MGQKSEISFLLIIFLLSSNYLLKGMYVLTSFCFAHWHFHHLLHGLLTFLKGKNKYNFIFHRTATIVCMRGYENKEEGKPKLTPENEKKKQTY